MIRLVLGSGNRHKEIVMDLNLIATTQIVPENQLQFDAAEHEQAVLRAERRKAIIHGAWVRLRTRILAAADNLRMAVRLAPAERAW